MGHRYLDAALPNETRFLVDEHLLECPPCPLYMDQIRQTPSAMGTVSDDALSPDAWAARRNTFRHLRSS